MVRVEHNDVDAIDALIIAMTVEHGSDPEVQWLRATDAPYNILVAQGAVYVVPRAAELPRDHRWVPSPSEINDNWKFGCAEVGDLFFPRTLAQYRVITDVKHLAQALLDVTLTDAQKQSAVVDAFCAVSDAVL